MRAYRSGNFAGAVKHFVDGIKERKGAFEKLPQGIQNLMLDNSKTIGELETEFPILDRADASKITIKTLLVKGEKSPGWLQAIVDNLSKSMPNSSLVEIPGSGHLPHIEKPAELNAALLQFLRAR